MSRLKNYLKRWGEMIRTGREIRQGERIPPFYYGLSYIRYESMMAEVWHIIPINYFIRWGRNISFMWDGIRANPSKLDNMFAKIEREAEHRGFGRAFNKFMRDLDENIESKLKEKGVNKK